MMKKLVIFISAFIVVVCLASCGGNNHKSENLEQSDRVHNVPCSDSIAFNEFSGEWNRVEQYQNDKDYDNARLQLDHMVDYYDLSDHNDTNMGLLISLSWFYFVNFQRDKIGDNRDDIKKSMKLARKAFVMNADSARALIEKCISKDILGPKYIVYIKTSVDDE